MREIIFRGKRVDNGEWVYGSSFRLNENLNPFIMLINGGGTSYEVNNDTRNLFTGLTDKNGAKIFEGDILKISFGKKFLKAVVKFGYYNPPDKILKSHLGFYFDFVDSKSYRKDVGYWTGRTLGEIEVIGNIHDNPELLEGRG